MDSNSQPNTRKIKWTAETDKNLLLFAMGREISDKEFTVIAGWFDGKLTTHT
ncbi:hypothetical protein BAUCODRAFT_33058 [Baudoinia panamericana UAMH 10762]|uniref:Uncharacterized protein n=1 Tax=Baudoinia panamericana (strain UAMH 10762) TaxID=717646 RepID=M2LS88_BAUPA|nr:uncharacterized protein BAUCODRAFT_33058 [Baudoinia panamericana UAMH 10762]EMC97337.1 hypothetical protein BAUCODRAFT_33058 [Baudoinia panamericana UAMH 10762]